MLTARTDEADQRAAWEAGVTDFLTKSFDGGRLVAAVTGAATGTAPEATRRRGHALARLQDIGRERDDVLAAILDSAQDAVILATTKGEITYWNKGAEVLFGWHAEEVIG
jgi:PAS domain-containing protein